MAPFQRERTNFYSICYFGSLIRFAHFMIMLVEELPCLPCRPVTDFLSFRFLNNFLSLKNRVALKLYTAMKSGPSPGCSSRGAKNQKEGQKNRRGVTFLKYSFECMQQPVGQTWNGRAPTSNGGPGTTALPAGDDPGWNIFQLSGLLSNLWIALKNRACPEFTVLKIYIFIHSEFWTTCACPEK